uniref:Uncharacterized protein n=1 Tax=Lygus hesperus TaxID=30085 RepID=A0A0K8SCN1_LYGHE
MADGRKESEDKSVEKDKKSEDEQQAKEMGVEEENKGVVDEEQQRKELEILQEQKEKLKEELEKDNQRLAELTQQKENIDRMATEAKETADDILRSYDQQDEMQQNVIEDQSARSLLKENLSTQIESIRDTQGGDSPELEILEAKLKRLEEEEKKDEAREKEINKKKNDLEKLLMDHAVSISEIETKKKTIEEEIINISTQRKTRELEEQKLLARISELKERVQSTAPKQMSQKQVEKEVPREGSILVNNSSLIAKLREEESKAVIAAKAMRVVKEELAEILKKDHLTEEDIKCLPLKQNEVLSRLAELDEITRRVQDLMGLTGTASPELSQPSKLQFLPDVDRPRVRMLSFSQLRPEDILPQVVICGTDVNYPQIVVCESPKFRDVQERIVHNGRINAGTPQWSYPGARSDVFGPVRPGDGQLREIYPPHYGARMEALSLMGPFGQSNMPIAYWMTTPGFGYTIRPPQAVQGPMIMSQRMFHPGVVQSASVGSVVPCPCNCPKKRRKRNAVIQQVYSCPNVQRQRLRCNRL